jgi:hypothetical protein
VRRSFFIRGETQRNGSEILFTLKPNKGICFACFTLKQNSRFHIQNRKEMKQKSEAKQNKRSEAKKKAKITE